MKGSYCKEIVNISALALVEEYFQNVHKACILCWRSTFQESYM